MPPEFTEELLKLENLWKKKANQHAWIVSVVSILSVLLMIFLIYGQGHTALAMNDISHKKFASQDSVQNIKLDNVIRNQNMIYYNLVELAKKQGLKIKNTDELFLNKQ